MTIESFDVVFYTAIFVLPGFIMNSIIDSMNPPKKHNDGIYMLKCIAFSIINCAIWSWLYKVVLECKKIPTIWHWILLILISLIGATILGILISIFKQLKIFDRILSKLKVNTIHSTPTAWDYYFSKQKECFIIITLTDDTKLYGWYSSKSFTSSDPDERDIFVEFGYHLSDNGKWCIDDQSDGFYVPKDQIKYIEMKRGKQNEQQENASQ